MRPLSCRRLYGTPTAPVRTFMIAARPTARTKLMKLLSLIDGELYQRFGASPARCWKS